jgi:hypothetical protein
MSASTTGMLRDLKRPETVLLPEEIPPVSPTILISSGERLILVPPKYKLKQEDREEGGERDRSREGQEE